jgi:two-component system OmpR family response regulator
MSDMVDTSRILVVDDAPDIQKLVSLTLAHDGFEVEAVGDGKAMHKAMQGRSYDLVVLDLVLPGEDGLTLCRKLRAKSSIPIVMLTGRGDDTDRIVGLELGADDYVVKPFNPRELLARVRAVLRRSGELAAREAEGKGDVLFFEGWSLNLVRRMLHSPEGKEIELTAAEFELLTVFAKRPKRVLTRDQLLDFTKGRHATPFDRTIDVQLSRLRRKLEIDPRNPDLIKTVRGVGYIFACDVIAK